MGLTTPVVPTVTARNRTAVICLFFAPCFGQAAAFAGEDTNMRAAIPILLIASVILPGIACADIAQATRQARSGLFDASGDLSCAQEQGQELGLCAASVARAAQSSAVVVTFPNGFARTLLFADGSFLRANATMSGTGTDSDWSLTDGIYQIRVDDQRFEIPKALVFGD